LVTLTKQFTTDAPRVLSERYLELMRHTWERDAVNKRLREIRREESNGTQGSRSNHPDSEGEESTEGTGSVEDGHEHGKLG
jgi:hypothetical protein